MLRVWKKGGMECSYRLGDRSVTPVSFIPSCKDRHKDCHDYRHHIRLRESKKSKKNPFQCCTVLYWQAVPVYPVD